MAAFLYESLKPKSEYIDRKSKLSPEEYQKKLSLSTTLYVGNLSIYTRDEAIYELFSKCGELKDIKVGLNQTTKQPAGFCFVEYCTREDAFYAVDCLNLTMLDDRVIRADWDIGFVEGRQFGRGRSGGQVRDEFRTYEDPGRGAMPKQQYKKKWENKDGGKNNRRESYQSQSQSAQIEKDIDDYASRSKPDLENSDSSAEDENYRRKKVKM